MERLKEKKGKTVLITGATGFLGSHITEKFVENGYKVIILKRSFSNIWRIKHIFNKLIYYNIDKVDLSIPFEEHNIDVIIHVATKYGRKQEKITEIVKVNLELPLKLLELSVKFGVKVFFNTDTILPKFVNYYSLSKNQFVEWLHFFSKKMKIFNLKLEHIYGERDDSSKFVSWVIIQLLKDVEELNLTKGCQKRDFIYVKDVVDAYYKIFLNVDKFNIGLYEYEIGTGKAIKIRDLVLLVKKIIGNNTTILNFGVVPYRENEIMFSKANITSIKKDVGWEPKYSLEEGLKKTIKWFKRYIKNGKII